jgi:hypothetical protein
MSKIFRVPSGPQNSELSLTTVAASELALFATMTPFLLTVPVQLSHTANRHDASSVVMGLVVFASSQLPAPRFPGLNSRRFLIVIGAYLLRLTSLPALPIVKSKPMNARHITDGSGT